MGHIENVKAVVGNTAENINNVVTTGLNDIKLAADGLSDIVDTSLSDDNVIKKGKKIADTYVNTSGTITKNNLNTIANTAKNNLDTARRIKSSIPTPANVALSVAGASLKGTWKLVKTIRDDDGESDFIECVNKVDPSILKARFQNALAIYLKAQAAVAKTSLAGVTANPAVVISVFNNEKKKIVSLCNDIKKLKAECNTLIVQLEQISKKIDYCVSVIQNVQSLLNEQSVVVSGDDQLAFLNKKIRNKKNELNKIDKGIKNLISKLKDLTSWEGGTIA